MNTRTIEQSVYDSMTSAVSMTLGAMLLLVVLLLTNALQVNAQEKDEDFSECVDQAFAEYNSCLMDSGWWFSRLICDLDFEGDVTKCTAEQIGQIRGSFQPH